MNTTEKNISENNLLPKQVINEKKNTCSKCGQSFEEFKEYCSECSTKLNNNINEKKYCSKCGNEVAFNNRFCTNCGNKIIHNQTTINYKITLLKEKIKTLKTRMLKYKKIIIIIIAAIILSLLVLLGKKIYNNISANSYATQSVELLLEKLEDPSSYALTDNILVFKHENKMYAYITYSEIDEDGECYDSNFAYVIDNKCYLYEECMDRGSDDEEGVAIVVNTLLYMGIAEKEGKYFYDVDGEKIAKKFSIKYWED